MNEWSPVRVRVPATTANLGPGFDTLGMALSLHNELEVRPAKESTLSVSVRGEGEAVLPHDGSNLVALTFAAYFESRGLLIPEVELNCQNSIPLARGLGSSAAAIVAALVAADEVADRLYGSSIGKDALLKVAVDQEGHPDNVAAALFGGLVVVGSTGDPGGERDDLKYYRLSPPSGLFAVVAIPPYEVSTREARSVLPAKVNHSEAVFNVSRVALLVAALATGDLRHLGVAMEDRIHQTYRESLVPGFSRAVSLARGAGAVGVALSGSGSSVLALTASPETVGPVSDALRQGLRVPEGEPMVLELALEPSGCMVLS